MRRGVAELRHVERRLSRAVVLVGVALLCSPVASPAALGREAVPILNGSTTVVTRRSGMARVWLPEAIPLNDLHATINGDGRVIGLVLTTPKDDDDHWDPTVALFRFNWCRSPACDGRLKSHSSQTSYGLDNGALPRGLYELYIATDASTVTVNLRIEGRTGGTKIGRLDEVSVDVQTLETHVATLPTGTLYSGGAYTDVTAGRGVGVLGLWAEGPIHLGSAFAECYYYDVAPGVPRPPSQSTFAPGCPGTKSYDFVAGPTELGKRGGFGLIAKNFEMPQGIGAWWLSAGLHDDFGAVAAWMRTE